MMVLPGRRRVLACGAAAMACGVAGRRISAAAPADFYQGKTVRLLVGSAPGGGNDSYARLLMPHLAKMLGAEVVVANEPGAGGLLALNQLYAGEPDGLTIMVANAGTAALSQLLGLDGVRYDVRRLVWLAGIEGEVPVIFWGAKAPFQTLADAQAAAAAVKWSATGRTAPQGVWTSLLTHALGIPSNLVVGYKSSSESALAAMRGEVDGVILNSSSAKASAKDNLLRPVAALAHTRSPMFPDVPTIFELAELPPEQAWWIDYCIRFAAVGRALVSTPDVPAERVEFLADACRRIVSDEAVLKEADAAGRPLSYRPADEVKRLALGLVDDVDEARLAEMRRLLSDDGA